MHGCLFCGRWFFAICRLASVPECPGSHRWWKERHWGWSQGKKRHCVSSSSLTSLKRCNRYFVGPTRWTQQYSNRLMLRFSRGVNWSFDHLILNHLICKGLIFQFCTNLFCTILQCLVGTSWYCFGCTPFWRVGRCGQVLETVTCSSNCVVVLWVKVIGRLCRSLRFCWVALLSISWVNFFCPAALSSAWGQWS